MLWLPHALLTLPARRVAAPPGGWEAESVAVSFLLPPALPYMENGDINIP